MSIFDPRNVSTEGLNPSLAVAVEVLRAAILATPDTQTAYAAGQKLGELVAKLRQIQ